MKRTAFLLLALLAAAPPALGEGTASRELRYEAGKFGRAARLDRPGDRIDLGLPRAPSASEGTLELWVRPETPLAEMPPGAPIAVLAGADGAPALALVWAPPDGVDALVGGASVLEKDDLRPLGWSPGTFHHLALRWDADGAVLYADGAAMDGGFWNRLRRALFGGGRPLPAFSPAPVRLSLGGYDVPALAHLSAGGAVDDVRLSARARSGAEIQEAASGAAPSAADRDALLLAPLDGEPLPPISLRTGRPLSRFAEGEEATLTALVPLPPDLGAAPILGELRWRCRDAAGNVLTERARKVTVAPGESALLPIALAGAETPGFLRIEIALLGPDGRTLNRGEDFFWIAEAPPPSAAEPTMGAGIPFAPRFAPEEAFAALGALGVRLVKLPAGWADLERTPGVRDWRRLDAALDAAERAGIAVALTLARPGGPDELAGPPAWARAASGAPDEKALEAFLRDAAARYRDRVRVWQLWHRPDLPGGLSADAAARLQRTLAAAVRGEGRTVLSPGLPLGSKYLEEFLAALGAQGVDAWDLHPPRSAAPADKADGAAPPLREAVAQARETLARAGADRPIWLSEIAYYAGADAGPSLAVGAEGKADRMAKAFAEALSAPGVAKVLWGAAWGGGSDRLLDFRARPARGLGAFQALLASLDGATYVGPSGYDPDLLRARVFERADRQATVLWSAGAPARVVAPERKRGSGWFTEVGLAEGPSSRSVLLGTEIEVGAAPLLLIERADRPSIDIGEIRPEEIPE